MEVQLFPEDQVGEVPLCFCCGYRWKQTPLSKNLNLKIFLPIRQGTGVSHNIGTPKSACKSMGLTPGMKAHVHAYCTFAPTHIGNHGYSELKR